MMWQRVQPIFRAWGRLTIGAGWLCGAMVSPVFAQSTQGTAATGTLETVSGTGCYQYSDRETPETAREMAEQKARERAVESHYVKVQAYKTVENYQLKKELIETASAGYLKDVRIEREEKKPDQTICVTISARLSPLTVEETVRQQVKAKQISEEAASTKILSPSSGGGIRITTNKQEGQFVEDERLVLTIVSDVDGYLKLDYYQADHTVVHLVPNLLNQEVRVKAGEPYVFGDGNTPPYLVVQGPYGHETIKAMVSPQPWPSELNSSNAVDDSRAYMDRQKVGTRGVRPVFGVEQSISIVTIGKAVQVYRDKQPPAIGTGNGQNGSASEPKPNGGLGTSKPTEGSTASTSLKKSKVGKDGAPMVLVSAGTFRMGSLEDDEGPVHSVFLDSFYIDQHEVTTKRYATFLQDRPRGKPKDWSDQIPQQHGNKPVVGVDWNDAVAYCAWAGKRLPTEAEWEKAARGTDQRNYPWGNAEPNRERANFDRCCNFKDYGTLTDVGSFEVARSPYGVYDLAGNSWEWVADWYDQQYYRKSPERNPTGPSGGEYRVLRGGSWFDKSGTVRSAYRYRLMPESRKDTVGFRCAQDASK